MPFRRRRTFRRRIGPSASRREKIWTANCNANLSVGGSGGQTNWDLLPANLLPGAVGVESATLLRIRGHIVVVPGDVLGNASVASVARHGATWCAIHAGVRPASNWDPSNSAFLQDDAVLWADIQGWSYNKDYLNQADATDIAVPINYVKDFIVDVRAMRRLDTEGEGLWLSFAHKDYGVTANWQAHWELRLLFAQS